MHEGKCCAHALIAQTDSLLSHTMSVPDHPLLVHLYTYTQHSPQSGVVPSQPVFRTHVLGISSDKLKPSSQEKVATAPMKLSSPDDGGEMVTAPLVGVTRSEVLHTNPTEGRGKV